MLGIKRAARPEPEHLVALGPIFEFEFLAYLQIRQDHDLS